MCRSHESSLDPENACRVLPSRIVRYGPKTNGRQRVRKPNPTASGSRWGRAGELVGCFLQRRRADIDLIDWAGLHRGLRPADVASHVVFTRAGLRQRDGVGLRLLWPPAINPPLGELGLGFFVHLHAEIIRARRI